MMINHELAKKKSVAQRQLKIFLTANFCKVNDGIINSIQNC